VTADSTEPTPPSGGGNLKYAIVGVVLLLATVGIFFGMRSCEDEGTGDGVAANQQLDAGSAERPTEIGEDDLFIPDPEPDAGPPVDAGGPRVRYVTRYVGGGGGSANWNCSGDIAVAAVQSTIAEHRLQFRNCYERRLKVNNQLEGRVNVNMRVSRTGAVDAVQVGGTMRDPEVLSCVRGIAQRIRFPVPQGGGCAAVAVPFNFSPDR
jgi:hypothetical protein